MPYLGDYIGHLLSEVTNARVQADLESVRIAEIYASHPLLRNMPVPHFRLPKVDLDVPVAISDMKSAEDPEATGRVLTNIRESFPRVLAIQAKKAQIGMKDDEKIRIEKELDRRILALKKEPVILKADLFSAAERVEAAKRLSITTITDDFISAAAKILEPRLKKEAGGAERLQKLKTDLKKAAFMEFSKFLHENTRLDVSMTSSELKEIGRESDPGSIMVKIHLSISEEAFEWSVVDSEGEVRELLVPE